MVKQITVEELFGSSIPKDPSLPAMPAQSTTTASTDPSSAYMHNQSYPTAAHQKPLLPSHLAAQDSGSSQRHLAPGLLPAPYALHPNTVFHSVPRSDPQPQCPVSPLIVPPASSEPHAGPPGPVTPPSASTAYLGQEILSTLKPAVPSVNSDIHKPILAPTFLPSTLVPPHSFQEPMGKPLLHHSTEMDVFSQSPTMMKAISVSWSLLCSSLSCCCSCQCLVSQIYFFTKSDLVIIQLAGCSFVILFLLLHAFSQTVPMSSGLAVPGSEMSLLLSPSAFQQSINKAAAAASVVLPAPSEPSFTSLGAVEPPSTVCSKKQLQETLIHLIKVMSSVICGIFYHETSTLKLLTIMSN